jgi:predicted component of type VI protein secretion system
MFLGANCQTDDDSKKINIHVSVTINAGTLADLKKQRAQIRSSSADMSLTGPEGHPPASLSSLSMNRLDEVIGEKPFNRFSGDTSEAICDVRTTSRRCSIL